jgi:hypothetical protein
VFDFWFELSRGGRIIMSLCMLGAAALFWAFTDWLAIGLGATGLVMLLASFGAED